MQARSWENLVHEGSLLEMNKLGRLGSVGSKSEPDGRIQNCLV